MSDLDVAVERDRVVQNEGYVQKLSSPMAYFWPMAIFIILAAFVAAILYRQAHAAFVSNPGLNSLILGVLLIGIILNFSHVLKLRPAVWTSRAIRRAISQACSFSSACSARSGVCWGRSARSARSSSRSALDRAIRPMC